MAINATDLNETLGVFCHDSTSYRNPYNNLTCSEHKSKCNTWGQILRQDQFDDLLYSCPVTCNSCVNTSLPSISSFIKNNGKSANSLLPNELTTVAVLSIFGFVAIVSVLIGFFAIHKRSLSASGERTFPLPNRQDRVLFQEFHSEDALDSERSVCASSDIASSKSSSLPFSDAGVVLDSSSKTASRTINPSEISKHEAYISPINGFDIPPSPATRQLDIKCFTYVKKNSCGTVSLTDKASSSENIIKKDSAAEQKSVVVTKISSTDSEDEETPKVVHLLGYCLSSASSSADGLEYCATASSSEGV